MTKTTKNPARPIVTYWKDDGHVFPAGFDIHSSEDHDLLDYYFRMSDFKDNTTLSPTRRGHMRFGLTSIIPFQSAYACVAGSIILKPVECTGYSRKDDLQQEFHIFFPLDHGGILTRDDFEEALFGARGIQDYDRALFETPLVDCFTNTDDIIQDINNLRMQWQNAIRVSAPDGARFQ